MKFCLFPLQFKSSTPEMAGHRGRVYECLECGFREERSRLSSHVYKYHVPLSRAPFYCTLCAFRCVTNAQLRRHVVHCEPHVSRAKRFGPGASQNVLKTSDDPLLIGDHNVRLLTLAESVDHWDDRTVRASTKRARIDLLGEAKVVTGLEPKCKRIMPAHSAPATVTSRGMTTSLTPDYGDEVAIDLTVPAMPEGAMPLLEGDLFEEDL